MWGSGAVTHSKLGSTDPTDQWLAQDPVVHKKRISHCKTMFDVAGWGKCWPIASLAMFLGNGENVEDPERLAPLIGPNNCS